MLTVNSLSTRLFIYDVIMHVEICKQVRDRAFGDQAIAANVHRQNNNLNATVIQSLCSNSLLLWQMCLRSHAGKY